MVSDYLLSIGVVSSLLRVLFYSKIKDILSMVDTQCRPLEVAEEDGSSMTLKNGRAIFCLNKSQHFPWTLLKSSTVNFYYLT